MLLKKQHKLKAAALVAAPILVTALAAQQVTTLIITGQQGSARVVQLQGRNYVDIDSLARLQNGSISFQDNAIVLTLPGASNASSSGPANSPQPQPATGFSKGFLTAGIELMAGIREWHSALKTAIVKSVPIEQGWLGQYEAQARESLNLLSVAVSTDSDRSAYPLLKNEFSNMKALNDEYVQMTQSQTYIDPDSLQSDSLDQTIVACGHSLAAMAAAQQFVDNGTCQ